MPLRGMVKRASVTIGPFGEYRQKVVLDAVKALDCLSRLSCTDTFVQSIFVNVLNSFRQRNIFWDFFVIDVR